VAVSLRNDGTETYRHELYGDVITIERKINGNSGGAPFTVRCSSVEAQRERR
jgi:hypothetical protein